jgi:N-acetylornithine carbamoyltransferase
MRTEVFLGRDWIDAELDYSREEYETLIDVALELKRRFLMNEPHDHILRGKTIFLIFFNQSLRTRNSFEAGITQLGGHANVLDPLKIYTPALPGEEVPYATERICDVARTLDRYGHCIAIRMYGEPAHWIYGRANEVMKEFAKWARVPVINMECDKYHPTQALADLITIKEKFGGFRGVRFVMSWAYSGSTHKPLAVPQSCVLAATKMGMDVIQVQPEGFELDPEVIARCEKFAKESGGSFKVMYDMDEAFNGADVVYPKCWGSLQYFADPKKGKQVDHEAMKQLFEKNKHWICDSRRLSLLKPGGVYMHCLPADRGMEVTDEVIDGSRSVVFDQAENRLHAHKAIMSLIMSGRL